jgi:hypothetical protein
VRVTHATQGAEDDHRAASPEAAPAQASSRAGALAGLRQPIVVILLLIALFTAISGKPLDGFLMLVVATGLAGDAARGRLRPAISAGARRQERSPAGRRRPVRILAWLAAGLLFAAVVGTFSRYSWPATAPVVGLGGLVVAVGWRGPRRAREVPDRLPLPGTALWGALLVAGGLWELTSLLEQPSLTTTSHAHPTISALTDPLLGSGPGRSAALAVWLVIGWLLVER